MAWIPVDQAPPQPARAADSWAPVPRAPPLGTAVPPIAGRAPAPKVDERRLWSDPVLSPWAPPGSTPAVPSPTAPQAPPRTATPAGEMGATKCPRCSTTISYRRVGAPPWAVLCPTCGAQGRLSK